jgi:hypothetical protein
MLQNVAFEKIQSKKPLAKFLSAKVTYYSTNADAADISGFFCFFPSARIVI